MKADPNLASASSESPISLAVKNNLGKVVEILCVRGADKESLDSKSNPPLWNALKLEYFDIAETIVEQGADLGRFSKLISFVHQSESGLKTLRLLAAIRQDRAHAFASCSRRKE